MAKINVSLDSDLIDLTIDTAPAKNNVAIVNRDTRAGVFSVFNAAVLNGQPIGSIVVWSHTQAAGTSSTIPIPAVDDNGTAINWQVGNVTNPKTGISDQIITSPPWQLTMA